MSEPEDEIIHAGKYGTSVEFFQKKGGRWYWRLVSMNRVIAISRSEGYFSKQCAKDSLVGVRKALDRLRGKL